MALTYDDLVRDTPLTLQAQNVTLVENMPMIIRRAEDEAILRLDHDAFRGRLPNLLTVGAGEGRLDLSTQPARIMEVRSLRVIVDGTHYPLERRNIERMEAIYPRWSQGVPRFYAEDDGLFVFRLFPSPDESYQIEVHANLEPARLAPSVQESLLTRQYPRVTEMATLHQGAIFMRNTTDEQRYAANLDMALAEVNSAIARRRRDETGVKTVTTSNIGG